MKLAEWNALEKGDKIKSEMGVYTVLRGYYETPDKGHVPQTIEMQDSKGIVRKEGAYIHYEVAR